MQRAIPSTISAQKTMLVNVSTPIQNVKVSKTINRIAPSHPLIFTTHSVVHLYLYTSETLKLTFCSIRRMKESGKNLHRNKKRKRLISFILIPFILLSIQESIYHLEPLCAPHQLTKVIFSRIFGSKHHNMQNLIVMYVQQLCLCSSYTYYLTYVHLMLSLTDLLYAVRNILEVSFCPFFPLEYNLYFVP